MYALRTVSISAFASYLFIACSAHGSHAGGQHEQAPLDADWATRHMQGEHHISNFDPDSFFKLHDYDSDGVWEPEEIMRTYGLYDESNKDIGEVKKAEVVSKILELFNQDGDDRITMEEWLTGIERGMVLPDLGTGPGHHGDDEYEYEIHHWEKYHDENTREEDLIHPEDIAHFKMHEQMEDEAEHQAEMDKLSIVDANIPTKFRRRT